MVNIVTPSASMLLEIEKLVLDEISDFTPPNQGVNLCPAPEGHRDPIAKLLSSSRRGKRDGFHSNCDSMVKMMIHCDYVDCDGEEEDEEDEEGEEGEGGEGEDEENDENSDSRNYSENGSSCGCGGGGGGSGGDKRRRRRRRRSEGEGEEAGEDEDDKEMDKEKERSKRKTKGLKVSGTGFRNRIRRRRPTGSNVETSSALVEMDSQLFLHEDDYCLSPEPDSRSDSPSPVHLISGPNGHRSVGNNNNRSNSHAIHDITQDSNEINRRDQVKSPDVNQFLTHEPPDGCEKVNMVKDISKKSIRPLNSLSHVVLAPCPQKPCNPGFVLLPSQSSAFLPLTRQPSDHLTHLDNITNRLNNTDLIGNYQSIMKTSESNN